MALFYIQKLSTFNYRVGIHNVANYWPEELCHTRCCMYLNIWIEAITPYWRRLEWRQGVYFCFSPRKSSCPQRPGPLPFIWPPVHDTLHSACNYLETTERANRTLHKLTARTIPVVNSLGTYFTVLFMFPSLPHYTNQPSYDTCEIVFIFSLPILYQPQIQYCLPAEESSFLPLIAWFVFRDSVEAQEMPAVQTMEG